MRSDPVSVKLHDVSRSFGTFVALQPSTFEIRAGEFASLLGPSGCGKTTTLRLIAGFDRPDSGEIHIGDRDVTGIPPDKRRLGMVFQNYALFPHMTVAENIGFGLRRARLPRAETADRVRRMLDMIHLPGYEDRFPSQLSGGQQQRVALARSLVTEPSVLLLDEPMAALDKNLRQSMQFELRQIQRNFGITTILVTHDQEEALTMSDTVVVMNHGRVLQIGSPAEVYDAPRTRFVSEFLGASNLFDCTVAERRGDDGALLRISLGEGASAEVEADRAGSAASGDGVSLAVRPEKIGMSDAPAGPPAIEGRIVQHVFRGSSHAYHVALAGGGQTVLVYEQASRAGGADVRGLGSTVWIGWPREAQSVFDDASRLGSD